MVKKAAFTLIELIFAIVIIGITVISLPVMNQVLTKNINTNIIQEAVFGAATVLNETITYHWDENSINSDNTNGLADVINIGSVCEDDNTSQRYRLRPGHILEPYHRKCIQDLSITSADESTDNVVADVKDQEGSSQLFIDGNNDNYDGYKDLNYTINIAVTNNADFAGNNRNDMKKITADVTDPDGKKIISLTTYVANIGEVDYYKRSF